MKVMMSTRLAEFLLLGFLIVTTAGLKVVAQGSVARERVDPIFLRCDVTNLGPEDEAVRITWRHHDKGRGIWKDIFTADLTNDFPSHFFMSQWAGRGQYNPISLAAVMLSPVYVTRDYAGTYQCDVESAMSRGYVEVTVDVLFGPRTSIVITPGGRVQKKEGDELLLGCNAQCNPACSYRWYKSGRRIANSPSLQMASLSRQDGGLYACQARNEAGRSIKPVEIRVMYPPVISKLTSLIPISNSSSSRTNQGLDSQQSILLECHTQAWPDPHIQWQKGSRTLKNASHPLAIAIYTRSVDLEHKTCRLDIMNASCLDNGIYSCKASNAIGDSIRSVTISNSCPPFDITHSELCPFSSNQGQDTVEIERKLGEEVLIQFCFSGHPKPSVKIRNINDYNSTKNISEVTILCDDETNICAVTISIVVTNPLQYGRYEVTIANSLQEFSKTYDVISRQPPLPPQNVAIVTVTSTSVCISWTPDYDGGSKQKFNLTYTQHDPEYDKYDDEKRKPTSLIIEDNLNSPSMENRDRNIHPDNEHPVSNTSNNQIVANTTGFLYHRSSRLHGCLVNLKPSSFYWLHITAMNVYGTSSSQDVLIFKTLPTTTTTISTNTVISSTSEQTANSNNQTLISVLVKAGYLQNKTGDLDHIVYHDKEHQRDEMFPRLKPNLDISITNPFNANFNQMLMFKDDNDNSDDTNISRDSDDIVDFDNDDNDEEDFSLDESNTLHVLFFYFDDILHQKNSVTNDPNNNGKSDIKKQRGPFEVGLYFKRYVQVETQTFIAIPNQKIISMHTTMFPPNSYKYIESDYSYTPTIHHNTIPPIQVNGSFPILTSASVSVAAVTIIFLVTALVICLLRGNRIHFRGQRKQNKCPFKRETTRSCPGASLESAMRVASPPPSPAQSPRNIRVLPTEPNCIHSVSGHSSFGSISNKNQNSIHRRPRLSTPKLPQKDRNSYHTNAPKHLPHTHTESTSTPASMPLSHRNLKSTTILQIPGISVNDKRISPPSYLELCTFNSSNIPEDNSLSQIQSANLDTLSLANMNNTVQSCRASYSSAENMVTQGKLEANRYNSYLDLCEVLTAKSGSRSPSNIYDPLDVYVKSSNCSGGSYIGPNSPECVKKMLDVDSFQYLTNQIRIEQQKRQSSKQIIDLSLEKQLCVEKSTKSSHYEESISFIYQKDQTKNEKCNNIRKESAKNDMPSIVDKEMLELNTHCITEKSLNERNEKKALTPPKLSTCFQEPSWNDNIQSMIAIYNDKNVKGDEGMSGMKQTNDRQAPNLKQTNDRQAPNLKQTNDRQAPNQTLNKDNKSVGNAQDLSDSYYKNASKLKSISPFSTVKQFKFNSETRNSNGFDKDNNYYMENTCYVNSSPVRDIKEDNGRTNREGTVKNVADVEALSRKTSSHYYSDIDSNVEDERECHLDLYQNKIR